MGQYNRLDKGRVTSDSSDKPFKGGSRYRESTPSFESLETGKPGRGIKGMKVYKSQEGVTNTNDRTGKPIKAEKMPVKKESKVAKKLSGKAI